MVIVEKTESMYFKGEFAHEHGVTEVIYITEPEEVEKEFDNKKTKKISGQIEYDGYKEGLPNIFEMNDTSKNTCIDVMGSDTKKWMGIKISIVSSIGGNKKWQILVDGARLKKTFESVGSETKKQETF